MTVMFIYLWFVGLSVSRNAHSLQFKADLVEIFREVWTWH